MKKRDGSRERERKKEFYKGKFELPKHDFLIKLIAILKYLYFANIS